MTTFKKFNTFKDRGKKAEAETQKFLESWAFERPDREYNRLVDSKAAGRTIKAAPADFEFFRSLSPDTGVFGLIEVKQTEHEYRLERTKVTQLPRLRRRAKCGGLCLVLVLHSTIGRWRVVDSTYLATSGDKGSWNLQKHTSHPTPGEALEWFRPEVFG